MAQAATRTFLSIHAVSIASGSVAAAPSPTPRCAPGWATRRFLPQGGNGTKPRVAPRATLGKVGIRWSTPRGLRNSCASTIRTGTKGMCGLELRRSWRNPGWGWPDYGRPRSQGSRLPRQPWALFRCPWWGKQRLDDPNLHLSSLGLAAPRRSPIQMKPLEK